MYSSLGIDLLPNPDEDVWVTIQDVYIFSHQIVLIEIVYFGHLQLQLIIQSWCIDSGELLLLEPPCAVSNSIVLTSKIESDKKMQFNKQLNELYTIKIGEEKGVTGLENLCLFRKKKSKWK